MSLKTDVSLQSLPSVMCTPLSGLQNFSRYIMLFIFQTIVWGRREHSNDLSKESSRSAWKLRARLLKGKLALDPGVRREGEESSISKQLKINVLTYFYGKRVGPQTPQGTQCHGTCVQQSEANLWESCDLFSVCHVSSRDLTQVVRLGGKWLNLVGHPTGSRTFFF